jgi:MurNAc alpha-1-phosphate uridylyltransferase
MRPLTDTLPKPLVQLRRKALLDHVLDRIAEAGVPEAVVRSGAMASILFACAGGDKRRVNDFYTAGSYDGLITNVIS